MLYDLFTVMPMMVCLFWTATLLLDWRASCPAKHLLAAFMAVCTALYACHYIYFAGAESAIADSLYIFCNIAVFPLYYGYICRLTEREGARGRIPLLLIPAVIVTLCHILFGESHHTAFQAIDVTVFLTQLVLVCIFGYRKLSAFDRMISNLYADTERRSVNKTRALMLVLVGGALLSFAAKSIGRGYFVINPDYIWGPSLFFSCLLYAVGYVGDKQNFCIDDIPSSDISDESELSDLSDQSDQPDQPTAAAADRQTERLLKSLEKLMAEERLYLRHDLKLADVVDRLGASRTVVSQLINQRLGMTFSDYISGLRVEHAKSALAVMTRDDQMIDIMLQSGFQSETSFYRAFKKRTGMTPKEWLKRRQ